MEDKPVEVAISVQNVHKSFKLPHEKQGTIKSLFVNLFNGKKSYETQKVLKDVSFEINKGDFFGIVGRNGSGKSTLLKILAGIYAPNKGEVKLHGKLVPFIELGVGFNPELTGRENVYLNGALLGITRKEMDKLYKDIVEFAELEKFMDQKLKNYSSGMQVRLAFSIAIRAKGDILLLDEVLAVGDAAFRKKCLVYFSELKRRKQTVVLVSHDMNSVEQFCDRAMLLEKGRIKMIGKSSDIAREYEEMFIKDDIKKKTDGDKDEVSADLYQDDNVQVNKVQLLQNNKQNIHLKAFKDFTIRVQLTSMVDSGTAFFGVYIKNSEGKVVMATDSKVLNGDMSIKKGQKLKLDFSVENILTNGMYSLYVTGGEVVSGETKPLITKRPVADFIISGVEKYRDSLVHPKVKVEIS